MAARYPNDGPPESGSEMLPRGWTMRRDDHGIVYENRTTGDWTRNKNEMWRRSGAMPQQHMARPQQQLPGMPDSSQMPASTPQRSRMPYTQQIATSSRHQIAPPQNNIINPEDQSPLPRRDPSICGSTDELPGFVAGDIFSWVVAKPPSYPRLEPQPNFQDSSVLNRREAELSLRYGQYPLNHARRNTPFPREGFRTIDVQGYGFCAFNAMFGSLFLLGRSGDFQDGRDLRIGLTRYMGGHYNAEEYLGAIRPPELTYQRWMDEAQRGRGVGPEMFAVLAEWLEVRTIVYAFSEDSGTYEQYEFVPRTGRHTCIIHIGYYKGYDPKTRLPQGHYVILIPNRNNDVAASQVGGMRGSSPRPAQSSTSAHSQGSAVSSESIDSLTGSLGCSEAQARAALGKANGDVNAAADIVLAGSASNSLVDATTEQDIELIRRQADGATYAEAKRALQEANGDLEDALFKLACSRSRSFTNDSGLGQSGEHGK